VLALHDREQGYGGAHDGAPWRTVRGRCTVWYMTTTFETTRHIDAPPQRVWEVLFDVDRWPQWTPTIDSVERLDDGPFAVGSRAKVRQPKLPQAVWEVTEVTDGRSFSWQARGPGMRSIGRHQVVPDATGSTVTLSIEQAGPMGAVAALVWRRLTQRYVELEAESLGKRVTQEPVA
jgi:uncharacterized membrane protein